MQKQQGSSDCGVLALAFLVEVLTGTNVSKAIFAQEKMRAHLTQCLEEEHFTPFPKIPSRSIHRTVAKTICVKVEPIDYLSTKI